MPAIEISHELELNPELPDDIMKIAAKQGEDPGTKCELIQQLRDMIYEKGECTPHRTDDEYLIKFLRARFWRVGLAYKLLCRYYEFREANRELHEKVRPLDMTILGEEDIIQVTPYRDQLGRRISIYTIGNWKPNKLSIDEIFKATLIMLEIGSLEPTTQVVGGVGVFDLRGLSFNHVPRLTPSVAQKMISLMVTSMPTRTTALHIVNQNWVFNAAFQIFKPFLSSRMREKIFVHGSDMSSLHKHIHPEHLPIRYGGCNPDYPYSLWIENLAKNEKVIKELEQLGYVLDSKET